MVCWFGLIQYKLNGELCNVDNSVLLYDIKYHELEMGHLISHAQKRELDHSLTDSFFFSKSNIMSQILLSKQKFNQENSTVQNKHDHKSK